jgi:peptidyl-prolyl cis-trans isomerase B (cyclophilin B)
MKKSFIFKILAVVLAMVMGAFVLTACSGDDENTDTNTTAADEVQTTQADVPAVTDPNAEHTKVKFEIEIAGKDAGSFTMELYPEYAPITVANFIKLVNEKFYDGVNFHRVLDNFMAQGGMNTEKRAPTIKGEFALNGVENNLQHDRGIVSMARSNLYNSASSQFFICYNREGCAHLDGYYAAFGKVIEGMEVVDSFLDVQRNSAGLPAQDIVITSAYIVK